MFFYPTPDQIVKLIRKHIPGSVRTVLEPAVGEGALLDALGSLKEKVLLTLVEVDKKRIELIRTAFQSAHIVNDDFLHWSTYQSDLKFDLIITNPPFSARKDHLVSFEGKRRPIEFAFIMRCLQMLSDKGTLIAIVPGSLMNSDNCEEFRALLLNKGNLKYVYQLPARSFSQTEGSFFLLVFKNSGTTHSVRLRHAELGKVSELNIPENVLMASKYRFDFLHYQGRNIFEQLYSNLPPLAWAELGNISRIKRGSFRSNYKDDHLIHTTSFSKDLVIGNLRKELLNDPNFYSVAVQRVSRNACFSFSLIENSLVNSCTDCVIVFSFSSMSPLRALFFLRGLFANDCGSRFLMKGTGAKFLSVNQLSSIRYFDLSGLYPEIFEIYSLAFYEGNLQKLRVLEQKVFFKLAWGKDVLLLTGREREKNKLVDQAMNNFLKNASH